MKPYWFGCKKNRGNYLDFLWNFVAWTLLRTLIFWSLFLYLDPNYFTILSTKKCFATDFFVFFVYQNFHIFLFKFWLFSSQFFWLREMTRGGSKKVDQLFWTKSRSTVVRNAKTQKCIFLDNLRTIIIPPPLRGRSPYTTPFMFRVGVNYYNCLVFP